MSHANPTNPLSEFQTIILSAATNLVRLIDQYTILKQNVTGVDHNAVSEFRNDAWSIAFAAACELVNDNDETFQSHPDGDKAAALLEAMNIHRK